MTPPILNAAQTEAVTATEGFVRVIAGAGSGKTRALAHRFAYLVNELGIMAGNILCVTFTNKSSNEMRQRIHALTGDNDTGRICTFHSFCVSVLQEDSHAVQYPKSFLVLDNSDIDSMLRLIYDERALTLRDMTFADARDMIEIRKNKKEPDYYLDMINMSPEILLEKYRAARDAADIIFYGYLYQEKKCFGLDYNDLINFTLYIFSQNEDIKLKWQKRLEYIMIDEFQDIDEPQYTLMKTLCAYHKNLFVVGDPDQTIYTWRGADVRYLLDFDKAFPNVKTIMMNENYRSTPEILAAVNSLIDKNLHRVKKDLLPTRPAGTAVVCHCGESSAAEAEWIAEKIKVLHESGAEYRSCAVLYRAHYLSRAVEEAFLKEKIPYVIYSGVQFFDRKEVKDALSYLRLAVCGDDLSFERIVNVPRRGIGRRRMTLLREYADGHGCTLYHALKRLAGGEDFRGCDAEKFISLIDSLGKDCAGRSVSELLSEALDASGYEEMLRTEGSQERLDNLAELKQSVYEFETSCGEEATVTNYLSHVALFSSVDAAEGGDKVKLMTVHAAKGLEFPRVFLCAMNEGVFPSKKTRTVQGMEEERRLAFVAMTRAKDELYLSAAEGEGQGGAPRYPSRFLLDIDPELLSFTKKPRDGLVAEARRYIDMNDAALVGGETAPAFAVGDRVGHTVFGNGTVIGLDAENRACLVKFDELDTPRKISYRAKLEKQ